jgi:hypothetical protein
MIFKNVSSGWISVGWLSLLLGQLIHVYFLHQEYYFLKTWFFSLQIKSHLIDFPETKKYTTKQYLPSWKN